MGLSAIVKTESKKKYTKVAERTADEQVSARGIRRQNYSFLSKTFVSHPARKGTTVTQALCNTAKRGKSEESTQIPTHALDAPFHWF